MNEHIPDHQVYEGIPAQVEKIFLTVCDVE